MRRPATGRWRARQGTTQPCWQQRWRPCRTAPAASLRCRPQRAGPRAVQRPSWLRGARQRTGRWGTAKTGTGGTERAGGAAPVRRATQTATTQPHRTGGGCTLLFAVWLSRLRTLCMPSLCKVHFLYLDASSLSHYSQVCRGVRCGGRAPVGAQQPGRAGRLVWRRRAREHLCRRQRRPPHPAAAYAAHLRQPLVRFGAATRA